jgi:murein DD-endopeptidase MepM/ murein hydrolase activator NlpD
MVAAWPAAGHWMAQARHPAGGGQADALGLQTAGAHRGPAGRRPAASAAASASQQPVFVSMAISRSPGRHRRPGQAGQQASAPSAGYLNPLRGVSGLIPERIDEGVDFAGSGPVYALGDAVITNASQNSGWPGGGWITYQLTDGPEAGLMVYVAEDVTPDVQVGQHVSSSTVIASMFAGGYGIETGWADPGGVGAESELPEAGGIGANGPFPTRIGVSFDALLQSLGVPAAPNSTQPAYGLLPSSYPAS